MAAGNEGCNIEGGCVTGYVDIPGPREIRDSFYPAAFNLSSIITVGAINPVDNLMVRLLSDGKGAYAI